MNIIYIVPYVPSLIRVRSYNLIRALAARNHQVSIITIGSNESDRIDAERLKSLCLNVWYFEQPKWLSFWNSIIALPTARPLQSVYSWNRSIAKKIDRLVYSVAEVKHPDLIHVEHLRGSRYGIFLKTLRPMIPIIFDSVDCISYLFEQASGYSQSVSGKLITKLELNRTRNYEAHIPHQFDHVLVTSKVDMKALEGLVPVDHPKAPISIIHNGVDIEYFYPNPEIPRDDSTIIFSGKMSYHANITMALYLVDKIMPLIWAIRPDTQLYIVGKDPSTEIKALERIPGITVTGTVTDLRPYLWKATVAVVPLIYGAGSQLKLLEAMACGLPVVATSRAALPLTARSGVEILLADDPQTFADAVLGLFLSKDKRDAIALSGLNYVQRNHNWSDIAVRLEDIYLETINRHPRLS